MWLWRAKIERIHPPDVCSNSVVKRCTTRTVLYDNCLSSCYHVTKLVSGGRSLLGDAPGNQPGGFGGGNQGNWDDQRKGDYNEPAFSNEPNQFNQGNSFNGPQRGGFNGSGFSGNGPQGGNFGGNDGGFGGGGGRGGYGDHGGRGGYGDRGGRGGFRGGRGGFSGGPMDRSQPAGMMNNGPEPGAVLVVYGLAEGKFNCEKIFNLFCCYGNVMRVKILMSKEGGCMVNMGDRAACERVVMNLNHSYIYDKKFSVAFSKQDFVKIHPQPSTLDDGTPSQRDFTETRNNRFFGPESVMKTRFSPPTKVLHFFNAPHTVSESELKEVFTKAGAEEPVRVRIFPVKSGGRSAAGLIEFAGPNEATAALIEANHSVMPNKSGRGPPYSLKLAFSASPILDKPGYDGPSKKDD